MNFLDSMGWSKKLSHATVPLSQALAHVMAEKKSKSPETIPFKKSKRRILYLRILVNSILLPGNDFWQRPETKNGNKIRMEEGPFSPLDHGGILLTMHRIMIGYCYHYNVPVHGRILLTMHRFSSWQDTFDHAPDHGRILSPLKCTG
jgi:hypothetical protein